MKKPVTVEISKKLVVINTATSLLTYIFSVTILVWVQQYLLRRISPEEYSLLPIVGSLVIFTPIITTIFTTGISRYLVEAYAQGNELEVTKIVSSIWPFILATGFVLLLICCLMAFNIEHILNIPKGSEKKVTIMLLMAFFNLLLGYILAPFLAGFNIRQKFYLSHFIETGLEIFRMIFLLFLLFNFGANVLWVVLASTVSSTLKVIIRAILSVKLVPALHIKIKLYDFDLAKKVMNFGIWSFVGQISNRIRTASDPILLNLFATPLDISTYHIGSILPRQLDSVLPSVISPLGSVLIAMHVRQEKERLKFLFFRLNKYLMWATLIFIFPAIIYRKEIIFLYVGETYIEAATVLGLLFLPVFLGMSIQLLWSVAPAIGKIKRLSIIGFLLQLANLILTIIFLKYFDMGAKGSALSTCIIGFIALLIFLHQALLLLDGKIYEWFNFTFLPGLLPAAFGAFAWIFLKSRLHDYFWFELGRCFLIGSLVYVTTVILCLSKTDKLEIKNVFVFIRSKFPGKKVDKSLTKE